MLRQICFERWLISGIFVCLLSLTFGCTPLRNSTDSQIMKCGQEFSDQRFVKILRPDGSELDSTSVIQAYVLNSESFFASLVTSSKGCVAYSEALLGPESYVFISAKSGSSTFTYLGKSESLIGIEQILLVSKTQQRFEWSCPLTVPSSSTQIKLASDSVLFDQSNYVFEYEISQSKSKSKLTKKRIFQPKDIVLDLERILQQPVVEGRYTLVTKLYDLENDLSFQKPISQKECQFEIDRTAPSGLSPTIGERQVMIANKNILRLGPSQPIAFQGLDEFEGQVFFCIEKLDESLSKLSNECEDRSEFSVVTGNKFLPNEGIWSFRFFARDEAGNQSGEQSVDFIVVDDSRIADLKLLLNAAMSLVSNDPVGAIDIGLDAFKMFLKLPTKIEKEMVSTLVLNTMFRMGLEEVPIEIGKVKTNGEFTLSADGDYYIAPQFINKLYGNLNSITLLNTKDYKSSVVSFDAKNIELNGVRSRVYTVFDSSLKIFDLQGKLLNVIPLLSSGKIERVLDQFGQDFTVIGTKDNNYYVLKNDQLIKAISLEAEPDAYALTSRSELKLIHYERLSGRLTEKIQDLKSPSGNWVENDFALTDSCMPADDLEYLQFTYSPGGQYLIINSASPRQVVDLTGRLIVCAANDYETFTISDDDRFLVHVRNRNRFTNAAKDDFDFSLLQLKPGQEETILDSVSMEENVKKVTYFGSDQLLFSTEKGRQYLVTFEGALRGDVTLKNMDNLFVAGNSARDEILFNSFGRLVLWKPDESPAKSRGTYIMPSLVRTSVFRQVSFGVKSKVAYFYDHKIYLVDEARSQAKAIADIEDIRDLDFNSAADRLLISKNEGPGSNYELAVLMISSHTWASIAQSYQNYKWLGSSDDVLVQINENQIEFFSATDSGYNGRKYSPCEQSRIADWKASSLGNRLFVTCTNSTYVQFSKNNSKWEIEHRLSAPDLGGNKSEGVALIDDVDFKGEKAIIRDGYTYLWEIGKDLQVISKSSEENFRFMRDGRSFLAREFQTGNMIRFDSYYDMKREILIEMNREMSAFVYDPETDLIAMTFEDGSLQIYSGEGRLVATQDFKMLNKARAADYYGLSHLEFQDRKLKLATPAGAIYLELSMNKIAEKFCSAYKRTSEEKDYYKAICK